MGVSHFWPLRSSQDRFLRCCAGRLQQIGAVLRRRLPSLLRGGAKGHWGDDIVAVRRVIRLDTVCAVRNPHSHSGWMAPIFTCLERAVNSLGLIDLV